jgi:metal-sulfur cluster biosynthetic enzyme
MEEETKKRNPAKWEFESEDPERAALLRDSLREVRDPELGYSVIELGLIRNVVLQENHFLITMILTTPFCPYAPSMVEDVRVRAETALGTPVNIDLRMDLWDESMMEEGFDLDWGFF